MIYLNIKYKLVYLIIIISYSYFMSPSYLNYIGRFQYNVY